MNKEDLLKFDMLGELVIKQISSNESFLNAFIKFAPSIESDIRSASINKDCSCRNVVINYVNDHKNDVIDFLLEFSKKNEIEYDLRTSSYVNPFIGGKVAKTTINDWKDFCNKLNEAGATFKGFSVVKEGDDLYVFFI